MSDGVNHNAEFRGAVKAEIKGLVDDVQYIRKRIDGLPCTECQTRITAVETKIKTVSSIAGSVGGAIMAVLVGLLKMLVGK